MEMLETAVVVVHILVSLAVVALVLLQQGKGAEAGASFGGGASQTVFGSQGSGNFLTKSTSTLAVVFFVTSITLALIAKERAEVAAGGEQIVVPAQLEAGDVFVEPNFDNSGEPVEYNQTMEEMKASMESGLEAGMSGFAESEGKVPELE